MTAVKATAVKASSLLQKFVIYGQESFITLGPETIPSFWNPFNHLEFLEFHFNWRFFQKI
jgi:hypothetical protein